MHSDATVNKLIGLAMILGGMLMLIASLRMG